MQSLINKLLRSTKQTMLPTASYIHSMSQDRPENYIAKNRRISSLRNLNQLNVNAKSFQRRARVLGCGPSLETLKRKSLDQGHNDNHLFTVALNSSIFSGIEYDLAIFECPTARAFRTSLLECFDQELHLKGAVDNANLIFTNCTIDSIDDYLYSGPTIRCFILSQVSIQMPGKKSKFAEEQLKAMLIAHKYLSKLSCVPIGLAIRASLIRTIIMLSMLGFREIELIGFDGGQDYYYENSMLWPELASLKIMHERFGKGEVQMKTIKRGRMVIEKNHSSGIHTTADPELGYYTLQELIPIIAESYNLTITNKSNAEGVHPKPRTPKKGA